MKIGDIVQKIALARWSRTLSAPHRCWRAAPLALDVTGKTSGNAVIEETMDSVINSVKSGGTITGPLRQSTVFPAMVTHMVAVGEETGQMEEMLGKIADFYERSGRTRGQVAHVDHRADHDHLHRRDRRLRRHLDVPADVQGLPGHSVALRRILRRVRAARSQSLRGAGHTARPSSRVLRWSLAAGGAQEATGLGPNTRRERGESFGRGGSTGSELQRDPERGGAEHEAGKPSWRRRGA